MQSQVYALEHGDVLAVLKTLPSNSFHALLCDPPYGFRFMGKKWDYDVPSAEVWAEALRVLRPGAPLLSFGGARTYHRLACGIEDGGFELRDCMHWLYGKGYPKSQNVTRRISCAKCQLPGRHFDANLPNEKKIQPGDHLCPDLPEGLVWDGYQTALKPAYEPIALARKPMDGTLVDNVSRWQCGALNIGASRDDSAGRWPPNLILDSHSAGMLDAQAGPSNSTPYRTNDVGGDVLPLTKRTAGGYSDSGGPSRFFPRADYSPEELTELAFWYGPKVSKSEREQGCEALPLRTAGEVTGGREEESAGLSNPRAGAGRTGGAHNFHPTLKPIALIKYLARLILPPTPDAMILVPYAGSGSEMIGCMLAGWGTVVGIEGEADYVQIAHSRIPAWVPQVLAA